MITPLLYSLVPPHTYYYGTLEARNTLSTILGTAVYDSIMADKEIPSSAIKGKGGDAPIIQTLNVVPQKVIQVDKLSSALLDGQRGYIPG